MEFNPFSRRHSEAEREARDAGRLPPGQRLTEGWPVLSYGAVPKIDIGTWTLRLSGLVEEEVAYSWAEFNALPQSTIHCDIHCVTTWSKLDNDFTGVLITELLSHVRLNPDARFVMLHSYGGYTTNLPLNEFAGPDCLLAHSHNGQPLTPEHGGPVRAVVPKLYFWKSAKWMRGIQFMANDKSGFWEGYGYNNHGDPWKEERYS